MLLVGYSHSNVYYPETLLLLFASLRTCVRKMCPGTFVSFLFCMDNVLGFVTSKPALGLLLSVCFVFLSVCSCVNLTKIGPDHAHGRDQRDQSIQNNIIPLCNVRVLQTKYTHMHCMHG